MQDGDELVGTTADGSKFVMLVSNAGKVVHFSETEVRSMGRTAKGVRGIKLDKDHYVTFNHPRRGCFYFYGK